MRSFAFRSALFATLLVSGVAAHAEVVSLTGGRTLRVTGVTTSGQNATLTLTSGGSVTMPLTSIESITAEPVTSSLCAAEPFRCQDRAMLLLRRAQSAALAAVLAQHTTAAPQP